MPFRPTAKEKTQKAIKEALEAATAAVTVGTAKSLVRRTSTYWVLAALLSTAGAAWALWREPGQG